MARIKYASIVSSVSGSIGSATFQKSSFGDILRNKPIPRSVSSSLQLLRRNLLMTLHTAWANLSDDQRTHWNQFISYSQAKIRRDKNVLLNGHALFLQYNYMRLINDLAIMEDPTYIPLPQIWPYVFFVRWDDDHISMRILGDVMGVDVWFLIKISPPRSPAMCYNPRGLRVILVPVADAEEFDITATYLATFGMLYNTNDVIHYSVRQFSLTSPMLAPEYHAKAVVSYEEV